MAANGLRFTLAVDGLPERLTAVTLLQGSTVLRCVSGI